MEKDIYTYESRQNIYDEARRNFLECKPFEINGKMCESLIEVMYQDVAYLHSCLEDVKEIIIDDESGKRKEVKVGNTLLNKQLANTINTINKRILDAEKLKRELGKQMDELLNKNKEFQIRLKEETEMYGCGSEGLLNKSEKVFEKMSELLNEFVNSDTIAIQFVEYRNSWIKQYESYLGKYKKN
ncbi:MAG: hypothetical protein IJ458_04270 [Clostridia bacterium]|nr:hypothetical protein [Clostridia bacterium]MBQ8522851.1 hypothetical protein [Clostridia bacterium]